VSAVELPCTVEGRQDAPVLVLSNSLGSSPAMGDPQAAPLARRFRLVRYDHRGHGTAPRPPRPWRIGDLGDDVLALLDRLGVARAHFCGLSLGGMVGMWLAAHAPERVDRLVLCCTSARIAETDWAARAATVRARGTEAVAGAVVQRWVTPGFAAGHPELVDRLRAMIAATPAEGYAACCEVIGRMDLHPTLGAIRAPTLAIVGDEDPATPREHADRIAERIPRCRVVTVAGAHMANVESPEAVLELIAGHLQGPSPEEEP
jgi:3-oxoadipate enol-lactonase